MDTATINRIKRRLRALGVKGNTGGWVCVNEPRVRALPDPEKRPQGFASIRVQGWEDVARWVCNRAGLTTAWNMVEIRDGKRIGTPTIDGMASLTEYCIALMAPGQVCLRMGYDAFSLK